MTIKSMKDLSDLTTRTPWLYLDDPSETVVFRPGRTYVFARNLFDPSDVRCLFEVRIDTPQPAADFGCLDRLAGRGVSVTDCVFVRVTDGEDADCDLLYERGGMKYGFKTRGVSDYFPLIEGELVEGIYPNINEDAYYRITNMSALSKLYSCPIELGLDYDEFKLVCREDGVEVVVLSDGGEAVFFTARRRPFSFFDVFCPLCSVQIYDFISWERDPGNGASNRCELTENKCSHYVGRVEKDDGQYVADSIALLKNTPLLEDYLLEDYKLADGELYLKRRGAWETPLLYSPPLSRTNSYWSESEDGKQRNVFVFWKESSNF